MDELPRSHAVEVFTWNGEGYQPMVVFGEWLVALMNWEERFDVANVGPIERHFETDETFVLLRGSGVLFILNDTGLEVYDMQPGNLYNVTQGTWHNVFGSKDAAWLIVENRNTVRENSDYRSMTPQEKEQLLRKFPTWLAN